MNLQLKKQEKGFTIIEVLIVLAIAGLIMLIVFLAVPALQRNSRNTQRNNDASLISSAVNECITNKNGRTQSCGSIGGNAVPIDANKLAQLKEAAGTTGNITFCGHQGGTPCGATFNPETGANPWAPTVQVRYGDRCADNGDNRATGTARSYAVMYQVETNGGNGITRCLDA